MMKAYVSVCPGLDLEVSVLTSSGKKRHLDYITLEVADTKYKFYVDKKMNFRWKEIK